MSSDHLPRIYITADEDKVDDSSNESVKQLLDREIKNGDQPENGGRREDVLQKPQQRNKDAIREQLQRSALKLTRLLRDGTELVSNVVVADDKREIDRRMSEAKLREELVHVLQAESNLAMKKFREISRHWEELDEVKDPFNMNVGLEEQKVRIAELMQQKDAIISECRRELRAADENYYHDQEKHSEDLECMIDRINSHVETLKRAYRQQLNHLQQTITQERSRIKSESNETWTKLFDQKREQEKCKLEKQSEKLKADDVELERLVLEHEELIRSTKSRLEVDNECLQLELQKTKANVLLNTTKLDYNFEVLQRREEENVRNQQKKRLTKLHETMAILRRQLKDVRSKGTQETNKLQRDIEKLRQQIVDLKMASGVFAEANDQKYKKTWEMNQEECMGLVEEIRRIDKSLSRNELGIEVSGSEKELLQITDLKSFQEAVTKLNSGRSAEEECLGNNLMGLEDTALGQLFNRVVDKTGFIHEENLSELLEPLRETDSKLIRFSNLLNTLGIHDQTGMDSFVKVFKKYMWCVNCTAPTVTSCLEHNYVVDSDDILPALFELRKELGLAVVDNSQGGSHDATTTLSRMLDQSDVAMFWKQFEEAFPPGQDQLWSGLEYGLKQYLAVLRERQSLYGECEDLRQQNMELERLLENYKK